jgi:hypothetical protein
MPDKTTVKADEGSPANTRPPLDDPDLLKEWSALEDPEDRADYLTAAQALAELDEDELVPWEDVKAELGY